MQKSSNRGVVLLSTLFLVLVIAMFMVAASQVGTRSLFVTGATADSARAEAAAESGIQYALLQLRTKAGWRGNRNTVTINTPELVVREDNGNVIGYYGDDSQFRIRFNYQDGAGAENLPDPKMWIDHPYVSLNNVLSSTPTPLPRADGVGASVTENSLRPYNVPEFSVCLIVEGRAGTFQRGDFEDTEPNGRASTAVVEAVYRVDDISGLSLDAASMSAKDFIAQLPEGSGAITVDARAGTGQPRLRSKGNVEVKKGDAINYVSPDGEVLSKDSKLEARADTTVNVDLEKSTTAFYDLAWSQVKHADPKGGTLPAGTYVWWDDGSLHYYDLDYKDYVKFIKDSPTHAGSPLPPMPDGVTLDQAGRKLVIAKDVKITAATASSLNPGADPPNGLAVIPREGAPVAPNDLDFADALTAPANAARYLSQDPESLGEFLFALNGTANGEINLDLGGQFTYTGGNTDTPEIRPGLGGPQLVGNPTDFDSLQHRYLATILTRSGPAMTVAQGFLGEEAASENEGELKLSGVADSLAPSDLGIEFRPEAGSSAVLSADGNVRIGSRLEGVGGSITAGGDISLIGFGADFAANPDAQSGVSLYSKGNVLFSTFRVDKKTGNSNFQDVKLKGVVYAWGDIKTRMGHKEVAAAEWGDFKLEGAVVAYGGTPGTAEAPGTPGSGPGGQVRLELGSAHLTFDPAYLLTVMSSGPPNLPMSQTLWNRY